MELEAPHLSLTLGYLVHKLGVQFALGPNVDPNQYYLENGNTLRIVHKTPGSSGNSYFIEYLPGIPAAPKSNVSGFVSLSGGFDHEAFAPGNLLDNFDFQANPGGSPLEIHVADGVFEFASVEVQAGGVLQFVGPNPARLFSRGRALVHGLIDVSGQTPPAHPSDSPRGQAHTLARGGPNAGNGGAGADRPDNSSLVPNTLGKLNPSPIPPLSQGIVNPGAQITLGHTHDPSAARPEPARRCFAGSSRYERSLVRCLVSHCGLTARNSPPTHSKVGLTVCWKAT